MNNDFRLRAQRLLVAVLACFSLAVGCGAGEVPAEYQGFFVLPSSQQHSVLAKEPLEKQIDIYVFAVENFRPSAYGFGFSDDIAANGRGAVPVLIARLRSDPNESHRWALIHVFRDMVKFHYDFRNETDAVQVLTEVVGSMKGSFYRKDSENLLNEVVSMPERVAPQQP
jgi:hypothetical protein